MSAEQVVRYELRDRCAVIAIDRPAARNAVSPEVASGIEAALDRAEADPAVRVVVIAGGPPVFCAGADLKAIGAGRGAELATARGGFAGVAQRERDKPLIAAVDGPALAGGCEIVLACDLVVASSAARFGLPEVKRGLVAGAGGLIRLARKIPENRAMEAMLTGDPFGIDEAVAWGLVNAATEPGGALDGALELAARVACNAPLALRESRAVALAAAASEEAGWARSEQSLAVVMGSDDVQEGVRAFVEKREPVWTGT